MVDSIQGSGNRIIITTKPKPKESVEKKESFDDAIKGKTTTGGDSAKNVANPRVMNPAENNLKFAQQEQMLHMQKVQEIAKQVADGTYKMCDPAVLADKIFRVISDKTTREKFIKKMLQEEADKGPSKDKGKVTDLEMKKLVFMIKESQDEPFDDPELEEMLKELA